MGQLRSTVRCVAVVISDGECLMRPSRVPRFTNGLPPRLQAVLIALMSGLVTGILILTVTGDVSRGTSGGRCVWPLTTALFSISIRFKR